MNLHLAPATRLAALALALAACNGGTQSTETNGETSSATQTSISTSSPATSSDDTGPVLLCVPGEVKCNDDATAVLTCKADGLAYDEAPCGTYQKCYVDECLGPCELVQDPPSSEGCSFHSNRMRHYQEDEPDALIVGNISNDVAVNVQLYFQPNGKRKEEPLGDAVVVESGKTHTFLLENSFIDGYSGYRTGGTYHVVADLPIIAYQHSPLDNVAINDSSMLLPDHSLQKNYVVASYPPFGEPSYFNVIAIEDETTVQWTPPVDTSGNNLPIPYIMAGETGSIVMNRGDLLQIGASAAMADMACTEAKTACLAMAMDDMAKQLCDEAFAECDKVARKTRDLSGTVVTADKPIWVVGATNCAFVPFEVGFCDHLQEQMIPLDYWGKKYVGAHSPLRGGEKHYWRLYAGEDNVTITATPAQAGTPVKLAKRGDWVELEFDFGVSVIFEGDKPFLPVQYLAGGQTGPGYGDPAMYQMVPVEQFLSRYAFVTGVNYDLEYAQIIHKKGAADVLVDGVVVDGYYDVGSEYEVSDYRIKSGAHEAVSADPFGVIGIGYTIPDNCMPKGFDKFCGTDNTGAMCMGDGDCIETQYCDIPKDAMEGICRHRQCCAPCVSKQTDALCSTKDHPPCCTGPYASYAYPGGMRTKQIYSP